MCFRQLSFVNERRGEFTGMVADFNNGVPVMCIARNIGAWLQHSNTLSVLDCTILVPVRSACICEELKSIFSKQIAILGYGKEVSVGCLLFDKLVVFVSPRNL